MKKNTWLLIALIAVIFVSGGVAGFFTGRMTAEKRSHRKRRFSRSSKDMKAMFKRRMCKRLGLTDEQKKLAEPIIEQWLNEMGKLRKLHAPQYTAAFKSFYAEISPILSAKQKETLEKMHRKFTKHSPPPPPPTSFDNTKKGDNNASK